MKHENFPESKQDVTTHVADTWLLANGLHFLMLLAVGWRWIFSLEAHYIGFLFLLALIIFAASLPCLMIAYFSLDIIAKGLLPAKTLFLVWLVVCISVVFLEGLLGYLLLKDSTAYNLYSCMPALAATLFAVLFRYRQFGQLIAHYKKCAAL